MKKERIFSGKGRYFFAIILTLMYCIYGTLIMSIIINFNHELVNHYELVASVVNIVIAVTMVAILLFLKRDFGKVTLKSYVCGLGIYALPMMLFMLYYCFEATRWIFFEHVALYTTGIKNIFCTSLFYYITVGIAEELVFRCGILNCLLYKTNQSKKKIAIACICSGVLFGMMHLMGIFTDTESTLENKVLTIILACCIGFVFAVIFLKTKNLVVVVILHFAWDFTTFCNSEMIREKYRFGGSYNFIYRQIPIIIIMTIIAIIVLCKSKREQLALGQNSTQAKELENNMQEM
ncbi:MAG: CPBP family intramembrane metalloprotease [Lachnospiraceae bacterium]|nr:CPBP family intramembrane metalloprotease [Lachnospiraceae bacterium]